MAVPDDAANGQLTNENQEPEEDKKELTELEKYWKAVKDNPADFTGWTYLLQYVEQENDIGPARQAFDAFLRRYPYCYGYWKKYADLEKKNGNDELASKVFEKGLEAIPLSIDLWIHYINFSASCWETDTEADSKIQALYEKALAAAGTDFLSDKLWDKYISWEKERKNLKNVTCLYDKLLAIPTQLYSHHFENFTQHIKSNHPKEVLSLDEFLQLRQQAINERTADAEETQEEAPPPGSSSPPPPGADDPPTEEAPPGIVPSTKGDDEEIKAIRDKVIASRQIIHKKTEEEVSRRWGYEEGIRRPYFHVKPLERAQLKNWKEYLDFEIEIGSHERVVVLFERCMIACALYEEFWIKYANYLELHNTDAARHVYTRACTVHLPKKPNIHLNWSAFEEKQGNYDGALQIIENIESLMPGLVMISLRKINLLRRMHSFKEARLQYDTYIEKAEDFETKSFFAIKCARFLNKVMNDYSAAREVLDKALAEDTTNTKLYLQLIDLEYQQKPINEESIMKVFDDIMESKLSLEDKITFSQRKLEFLEELGSEVTRLADTYEEHQRLIREQQASKKRKASESGDDATATKKTKTEGSANGSGDSQPAVTAQTLSQQTAQQQHQPPPPPPQQQHSGHMDHYNYGGNPWGYHQGGYHNYHHGWNYGYGGYGQ